jgi:hypothetical protein
MHIVTRVRQRDVAEKKEGHLVGPHFPAADILSRSGQSPVSVNMPLGLPFPGRDRDTHTISYLQGCCSIEPSAVNCGFFTCALSHSVQEFYFFFIQFLSRDSCLTTTALHIVCGRSPSRALCVFPHLYRVP